MLLGGALVAGAVMLAALPRDPASIESRALGLLAAGDVSGALAALDAALAQTPADGERGRTRRSELLRRRGECNLSVRRPAHALGDFREAQALTPGDPEAWEHVGRALLALGRFAEAALHFEEAALAFPDRERYFRYAAGCAEYRVSHELLERAEALLKPRMRPGRAEELEHALERFSSTAERPPTREQIEETLLLPPHRTSERDKAFDTLLEARKHFVEAEERLGDFETSAELDPAFGRVRLEMHLRAGRYYELRRTAEILLRIPTAPERADELQRIRTLLANGLHELEVRGEAAQAFLALRRGYNEAAAALRAAGRLDGARVDADAGRRAQLAAVEERLRGRQGTEASKILEPPESIAPDNMLLQFYSAFARFLANDRTECVPAFERAARILVDADGRSFQFRDAEHREFVYAGLIEGLSNCGRGELAARIIGFALRDAADRAPLLRRRIELLRPLKEHLETVVADEFEMLKLERDHGSHLARWEQDWYRLQGRSARVERRVTEQAERVLRVYRSTLVRDPAFEALRKSAAAGSKRTRAATATLESAGLALLRELENEPCLVLQVYRTLVAQGARDQAHLLLFALVQSQPEIADFRFMLAEHDVAEGRLDDAMRELDLLFARHPGDLEIGRLLYDVARRRSDREATRRIVETALDHSPEGSGRLLAALAALDDGHPEVVLALSQGQEPASPRGRALLGMRALAELALARPAEAEELARSVLEIEPAERSALTARVMLLARRRDENGTPECDRWIEEHLGELGALDAALLFELARAAFEGGAFAGAEKLLAQVEARARNHPHAAMLRADALFALGRHDEVAALLAPIAGAPDAIDAVRRLVLVHLVRDGAESAWQYLRERLTAGVPESDLARWVALVGCCAGRLQPAMDVIKRRAVVLDERAERFVALTLLAHQASLPERLLPVPVAARIRLPAARTEGRDRELERWVSLDLASPRHRFAESLLRLLLLADLPSLQPLLRVEEARLLERVPSLGFLARARATGLDAAGDPAGAAAALARQIEHDPADVDSLRLLALFAGHLDRAVLERVAGFAAASLLDLPHKTLLQAHVQLARGNVEAGLERLREAAADPAARAAALVALANTLKRTRGPSGELGRPPWCEAVEQARSLAAAHDADRTLVRAALEDATDPVVLRGVARRLRDGGSSMDPAARQLLVAALVAQPGPWYEAYEIAVEEAVQAGADVAELEPLGRGLEAAIAASGPGPAPWSAVRALARLAELALRLGASEQARHWADLASRHGPNHPGVLATRGHLAIERGEIALARRLFERAIVFGRRDAEIELWLAEHTLTTRGSPIVAKALGERALELAALPTDADLRARAHEVIARANYLLGQHEPARVAWVAASRERGEDPRLSLPIALESFARATPEATRGRLELLANTAGPAQPLVKRLLALTDDAIAAAKKSASSK